MLPDELADVTLIPAAELRDGFERIPPDPGVYLFFMKGGDRILEQTRYFHTDHREPLEIEGHFHLYTGAANNLRYRISQHLRNPREENSSPRKTLLALEHLFGLVSYAVDSRERIPDQEGLTEWLYENLLLGYERHHAPLNREAYLIAQYGSAFNMNNRRRHPYSKWLMTWRAQAYPPHWTRMHPVQDALPIKNHSSKRAAK